MSEGPYVTVQVGGEASFMYSLGVVKVTFFIPAISAARGSGASGRLRRFMLKVGATLGRKLHHPTTFKHCSNSRMGRWGTLREAG